MLQWSFTSFPARQLLACSSSFFLVSSRPSTSASTPSGLTQLREQLNSDKRYRITANEFEQMVVDAGISHKEAKQLEEENIILRMPTVENYVFIQPERVTDHLLAVVDPTNKHTERKREQNLIRLEQLLAKKAELDSNKKEIEKKAAASTTRAIWTIGGAYALQGVLIARLTWWELSWDTMEPVTYLLTFGSSIFMLFYFQRTRLDFSYAQLGDRMLQSKRKKFYERKEFDIDAYERLCHSIRNVQTELVALGEPKDNINQYPLPFSPAELFEQKE